MPLLNEAKTNLHSLLKVQRRHSRTEFPATIHSVARRRPGNRPFDKDSISSAPLPIHNDLCPPPVVHWGDRCISKLKWVAFVDLPTSGTRGLTTGREPFEGDHARLMEDMATREDGQISRLRAEFRYANGAVIAVRKGLEPERVPVDLAIACVFGCIIAGGSTARVIERPHYGPALAQLHVYQPQETGGSVGLRLTAFHQRRIKLNELAVKVPLSVLRVRWNNGVKHDSIDVASAASFPMCLDDCSSPNPVLEVLVIA